MMKKKSLVISVMVFIGGILSFLVLGFLTLNESIKYLNDMENNFNMIWFAFYGLLWWIDILAIQLATTTWSFNHEASLQAYAKATGRRFIILLMTVFFIVIFEAATTSVTATKIMIIATYIVATLLGAYAINQKQVYRLMDKRLDKKDENERPILLLIDNALTAKEIGTVMERSSLFHNKPVIMQNMMVDESLQQIIAQHAHTITNFFSGAYEASTAKMIGEAKRQNARIVIIGRKTKEICDMLSLLEGAGLTTVGRLFVEIEDLLVMASAHKGEYLEKLRRKALETDYDQLKALVIAKKDKVSEETIAVLQVI